MGKHKMVIILLAIIVCLFLSYRFIFAYTIISIPGTRGKTHTGGSKHIFPVCIINPVKTGSLKIIIDDYVKTKYDEYKQIDTQSQIKSPNYDEKNKGLLKWWFFERLKNRTDYKISAIKKYENNLHVLIEAIDDGQYQCVVVFNKDIKIKRILF